MKHIITLALILLLISCSSSSEDKDKTAPGVLTNISTTSGDSSITFSWTLPSDNDIAVINVYVKSDNDEFNKNTNVTMFGLDSAKISGLNNFTSYTFKLTATDKSGNEGSFSDVVNATPGSFDSTVNDVWEKIKNSDNSVLSLIDELLAKSSVSSDTKRVSELRDAKGWYYYNQGNGLHSDDTYVNAFTEFRNSTEEDSRAGVAILGYLLKDFSRSLSAAKEFKAKSSYLHSRSVAGINGEKVLINGAWSAYRLSDFDEVKAILDILVPSTNHSTNPTELFDALVNFSK